MNERNRNYPEWDDNTYYTGPTEPPKNRGALVALLLIFIIFLCGIVTVLGVLNIRLFQKLNREEPSQELAISFTTEETTSETQAPEATGEDREAKPAVHAGCTMDLQAAPKGVDTIPEGGGLSLQEIYAKNIPSVVSISCVGSRSTSSGTGVAISSDGYLVTNYHVISDAKEITVLLTDDRTFTAQSVGYDAVSDLAVLHINAQDLTPARFGNSDTLRVGDTVVAIGDPLGVEFRGTYTNGIVSAINRDVSVNGRTMNLIQTNAALNSGNSGGPLINSYGQVVGINTMKIGAFTDKSGVEGLGFAIPSATVMEIVNQLISQGYVSGRPWLGIKGENFSSFYQRFYRVPAGLYITEVQPGSPAAEAGIVAGDILTRIDGESVSTMEALNNLLYAHQVGDSLSLVIYRAQGQATVTVTLTENKG